MSDVADSLSDERVVTGFVELACSTSPTSDCTVPGRTVRSEEVP